MSRILLVILFLAVNGFAQTYKDVNQKEFNDIEFKYNNDYVSKKMLLNETVINVKDVSLSSYKDTVKMQEKKSPIVAAALSAVIPGFGQLYSKNYLKAGIWFGVEIGLWTVYAIFQNKGDNQTNVYQDYAKNYWNARKYARWLKQYGFPGSGNINLNSPDDLLWQQINVCEDSSGFSHQLPKFGDQQYYEVIGKYQNYISGWSEANINEITRNNYASYKLGQVDYYMGERQRANDYYNNGSMTLNVVILNHILSAADAVWTVSLFNKSLFFKTSVNAKYVYSKINGRYNLTPFANLKLYF